MDWKTEAVKLKGMGWSSRAIAKALGRGKSTINDMLKRMEYQKSSPTSNGPKILFFDIETAPIMAHVWRLFDQNVGLNQIESDWHLLSFCAKWAGSDDVIYFDQEGKQDIEDDYLLLLQLWKLLNEADIVIGHNCVEVSTPVLTQELKWVPVGELKVGDKLVGFDEGKDPYSPSRINGEWVKEEQFSGRNVRSSVVTEHSIVEKDCVKVTLSNGDSIITTRDHYWLGRAEKDNNLRWYKSESLREGQRLYKYAQVWDEDESYEAGWLSGFISGEGTLKKSTASCVSNIDFCQRPGVTWNQALDFSEKLGIPLCSERSPSKGGLGKGDTLYTGTLGGKWKTLEYIGRLQIKRFIEKIDWDSFGGLKGQNLEQVTVVSVESVGMYKVAVMGTSTSTFIAGGYAMHNCKKFDVKKVNARFILSGLPKPSTYRQIDTLEIAKRQFGFTSNKLEYLTDKLCKNTVKSTHAKFPGHTLWSECIKGNPEAWAEMRAYNVDDVLSLEELYNVLSSWDSSLPNLDVYVDEILDMSEWVEDGFHYSNFGKYKKYRNTKTGQQKRSRVNLLDKDKRDSLLANI